MKRAKVETTAKSATGYGKGIPQAILDQLKANKEAALTAGRGIPSGKHSRKDKNEDPLAAFWGSSASGATSTTSKASSFSEFSMRLNLDEYDFPEEEMLDPGKTDVQLDVTALDRYNEEIRKYRRALLEECRLIPLKGDVDKGLLERVRVAASNLCRTCYYGTYKAHSLGVTSSAVLIWLLSRRNLPILFHINILQSVSEIGWTSHVLKHGILHAQGIHVIVRLLKSGMMNSPKLACWAVYTLVAVSIGSGETIRALQESHNMDEYIGEMALPHYWREWPTNFGAILQGVVFGPHSVSPFTEEEFEFL